MAKEFVYAVLGAGRQGAALAYDLARNGDAARIVLADSDPAVAANAIERLRRLLPEQADCFVAAVCDAADPSSSAAAIRGAHVVVSAVPYRFNPMLTDAAVAAKAHFCDLGGNTDVVREQLARDPQARAAGVSVIPDCGLAPGLGNILAADGVRAMQQPQHVHVRCGGLPEHPVGPLGYKLVFNFQGLINEYSGEAEFLRQGEITRVPTLGELEDIEFSSPVGRCEAAVTSGGTSTCPQSFLGTLQTYDYKTVRYPGHFAVIRALFELGCFENEVTLRSGARLAPRSTMQALMEERLAFPAVRDLVVLRTTVTGFDHGSPRVRRYDLFDRHDETTGFTAMERTTAFPTAIVAHLQARGMVAPGAKPLEQCIPTQIYLAELGAHDIRVAVCDADAQAPGQPATAG